MSLVFQMHKYPHRSSYLLTNSGALQLLDFLAFPLSRVRKHAVLEVNYLRLLQYGRCNLLEILVHRILIDIVIPVFVGVKSNYEGMRYTILDEVSRLGFG
jgi:hypothetical protein